MKGIEEVVYYENVVIIELIVSKIIDVNFVN